MGKCEPWNFSMHWVFWNSSQSWCPYIKGAFLSQIFVHVLTRWSLFSILSEVLQVGIVDRNKIERKNIHTINQCLDHMQEWASMYEPTIFFHKYLVSKQNNDKMHTDATVQSLTFPLS